MRKLVYILLLLVSTAFSSVTGMYSGRRVLCIGDDNHVAIEALHGLCAASSDDSDAHLEAVDSRIVSPTLTAGRTCVDYELPTSAVDRLQRVNLSDISSALLPLLTPPPVVVAQGAAVEFGVAFAPDDLPAFSLRCVRSIVLLI